MQQLTDAIHAQEQAMINLQLPSNWTTEFKGYGSIRTHLQPDNHKQCDKPHNTIYTPTPNWLPPGFIVQGKRSLSTPCSLGK